MEELNVEMYVHGYHVYRRIWEAAVNEELVLYTSIVLALSSTSELLLPSSLPYLLEI